MSSNGNDPCTSSSVGVRAYHVLNIDGYSRILAGFGASSRAVPRYLESCPFRAGERTWRIHRYPMGVGRGYADYIAIFLVLLDGADGEDDVKAEATFSLLDQDQKKTLPSYSRTSPVFNLTQRGSVGYDDFITREELQESGLLKDDSFAVRVDVHIISSKSTMLIQPLSSDMHVHLRDLLTSNKGADIEFHVSGETFMAHRLVLRVRSPIFKAQLPPLVKKGTTASSTNVIVEINDTEPRVFKALLVFIYTDVWPKMEHGEDFAMAQGLLVAADRYGMQRLKVMCENWLYNHIDTASVSAILALSAKQRCANLKKACIDFICSSTIRFAINETECFDHLAQSCPHIAKELIANVTNRDKEKGKHSIQWNRQQIDEIGVINVSNVAHTDSTLGSSLFYLFSGFVISIIVNSYIGV